MPIGSSIGHVGADAAALRCKMNNGLCFAVSEGVAFPPSLQNIFKELYKKGIQDEEMYTTFNCGVGFMLFVEKKDTNKIIQEINQQGFQGDIIGELIAGAGKVKIESMFSKKTLIL